MQKKQQDVEAILLELEEILKDVERMKGKVLEIDANIAKLTEQVAEQERTAETVKVVHSYEPLCIHILVNLIQDDVGESMSIGGVRGEERSAR